MSGIEWDAFISHASEDKAEVVAPLSSYLTVRGLSVWLDEAELFVGDSLRKSIDSGLAKSQFGIVILSHSFFSKNWPQAELDGLFSRDMGVKKVILPVWHKVTADEIKGYSPLLAAKSAAVTSHGIEQASEKLLIAMDRVGLILPTGEPIYNGALTKKSLFQFKEGNHLVSNCYSSYTGKPIIDEVVGPVATRDRLWEKVKSAGADGRSCHVLETRRDYDKFMKKLNTWRALQRINERSK